MRSVAVAAVPNIVQRSVRFYKARRSLYTRFDDRFIVQSSGGASRPLLRAYTAFVVLGVLLVRSDNLQGCAAPCSIRHLLYSPSGQLGISILAHGGIGQTGCICLPLARPFRMAIRRMMHHRRRPCSLSVILYPLFWQSQRKCNSYIP